LNCDEWADKMKSHLIGVHPSFLEIVNIGVCKPAEGEGMTSKMIQDLHHNAQDSSSEHNQRKLEFGRCHTQI
jgi:hypothetical protein